MGNNCRNCSKDSDFNSVQGSKKKGKKRTIKESAGNIMSSMDHNGNVTNSNSVENTPGKQLNIN